MKTFTTRISRIALFIIVSVCGFTSFAQTNKSELQQYFYPYPETTYTQPSTEIEKRFSWYDHETLKEEMFIPSEGEMEKVMETYYRISEDAKDNKIISNQQLNESPLGTRASQNKLTLFALPYKTGPRTWKKTVDGETTTFTSKYVYITYYVNGEQKYSQAVKISDSTPLNAKSSVKNWSYWVKGLGRIAEYGLWGNESKTPKALSVSEDIDMDQPVKEITKAQYDKHATR
ncbi:MAG: hypothetical protein HDS46_04075 [Bacteroides sp.]|nr:hypothetical protein [Bacteroides sp.]